MLRAIAAVLIALTGLGGAAVLGGSPAQAGCNDIVVFQAHGVWVDNPVSGQREAVYTVSPNLGFYGCEAAGGAVDTNWIAAGANIVQIRYVGAASGDTIDARVDGDLMGGFNVALKRTEIAGGLAVVYDSPDLEVNPLQGGCMTVSTQGQSNTYCRIP